MPSRVFQSSRLLSQSCARLASAPITAATRSPFAPSSSAAFTTATKRAAEATPAAKSPAKPAAKPATKPAARPAPSYTKAASSYTKATSTPKPTPEAPAPAAAPSPPPADPAVASTPAPYAGATAGNSTGSELAENGEAGAVDWSSSFQGVGMSPFSAESAAILLAPIEKDDVEIKPDGIVYLPEIKYRRILNRAFGPGGWGMVPRGDLLVSDRVVTREYALIVNGRFVAQARGENQYFSEDGITTAGEGCKSNALMRCCKDIGIASELWDPRYIRNFKKSHCSEIWAEHATTKKKRQLWVRKDNAVLTYPWQISKK